LPATAIVVDPAEFLGDVPCFPAFGDAALAGGGAMRRYVATLVSVHAGGALDAGAVELPSSPPTRCSDSVSFQRVVDGTAYVAEIDGYDVDTIRPLGSDGIAGSRVMVDDQNRFVAPRWQTTCGVSVKEAEPPPAPRDAGTPDAGDATPMGAADARPVSLDTGVAPYGRCTGRALEAGKAPENLEGPVCAVQNVAIPMRGCAPLREVTPPKVRTTAIRVDLADALGQCLKCGNGPGEVAEFRVSLDGDPASPRSKPCGQAVTFDLPAGKLANFVVTAYGSGASLDGGACASESSASDAGSAGSALDASVCQIVRQEHRGDRGVWCTRCYAQPLSGVTLRAACDPFGVTQRRSY
jgi:hypothetical protein